MKFNKIYNKSCENMEEIDNDSITLIVTSPPYFNLKDYSNWETYDQYLFFINNVLGECYRVLMPGGWVCWNIQESIPFPPKAIKNNRKNIERYCEPLLAQTINIMLENNFLYEKDIVWYKGKGTATQKLFGSFPYPSLLLMSGLTEHIIVVRKPRGQYKRKVSEDIKEVSKITKDEWGKWCVDLWNIPPARASLVGHAAPFPHEIPNRCIKLFSFSEDIVLDPFMGSGTTAIAAYINNRKYIGYELNDKYYKLSKDNILIYKSMIV